MRLLWKRSPRRDAPAFAGLLAVAAVCTGDAVARVFPFGPRTRSVNDLGNQFVPFHAHLWDLLHGRADGGPLLDWNAGYGTSFLPDLGTYLSSPFALLVGVFPRDRVDLAVYVITLAKTAAAAAAMAALLLAVRRTGPWWAAGVLAASYALCGWSLLEASYNPMWLDGLIALPLLCLAGEWARAGRRPLLGPVVVALAWTANFYTAYMATLGAALFLLARLYATGARPWRPLGRAVRAAALGIGLAAPVLVPVLLGTRHAYPGWTRAFAPAGLPDVLARALPATYSFFTPALFVGTGTLLLACALPFARGVARRERWVWAGLAAGVALSFQWQPTHLLWHLFATPNGSPYRQTFVLAAFLVLAAWAALGAGWPAPRALLGGAAVLGVAALGASASDLVTGWTFPLFGAGLAAAAAGALLAGRARLVPLAALLLAGALAGQAAATTAFADRARPGRLDDYPPWGAEHTARAAALAAADDWPASRTDPGRPALTGNDPLLLGGQGGAYYSSHTPAVLTRTLAALGGGWTSNGRSPQSLDNPVTDALFAVGARLRDGVLVRRADVLPLVTLRPPGPAPAYGPSPFRNQEALLGARVYANPADGVCPVGSEVFVWAPDVTGTARLGAASTPLRGGQPKRRAALAPLGTQRTAGTPVVLDGTGRRPGPGASVGCLDPAALTSAVAELRARSTARITVTSTGVRAELPPGARGTAVLAAPRIAGWSCDGRPADAYLGLVAAPVGPGRTTLTCTFRTPGLRAGGAAGAAALVLLAVPPVWRAARRRRELPPSRPPSAPAASPPHDAPDTQASPPGHRPVARRAGPGA
ncbi:YfhO family protein [Streptomyces sp. NPDC001941]|uniref:YfhO family protein n=1 Tax=Streptomyces sp. NPDC001941 TaxID=3154659 RepID=UPI0033256AA6